MWRRAMILGCLCGAISVAGCGGEPKANNEPHQELSDEARATARARPEFQQALERFRGCMNEAGYPVLSVREGIILKDGTVIRENSGPLVLQGAYLEYAVTSEECEGSSGLSAAAQQVNIANPTTSPAVLKRLNDTNVREMGCMKSKGWDIPEPVTSRGLLIFDVKFQSDENRTAYNVDYYGCVAELGTGQQIK